MPNEQRPLKVFLCHAHSDKDVVRDLYQRLTKDGVDAWLDKEKLLPGQDWELEIRKAVREADVVVVCLSKQFNQAGFRQKEVRIALEEADKQPAGEIFIIPARLEECDTLESLRKWHWVDLFEEDGYEMLMRALRARANKIGVGIKSESVIEREISSSSRKFTTVVDGLNWATVRRSTVFYSRLCDAFPGLRGTEKISRQNAVDRLSILLRHPLSVDLGDSPFDGQLYPLWWTRARNDMYVHDFELLGSNCVLINNMELSIDYVHAVREFQVEDRDFVYVQTLHQKPVGLYEHSKDWLDKYLWERLINDHGFYYNEEYALWNNKIITRSEYDDGAAIIDGKPTSISGAKLRLRYVTPFNFILCGADHVLFKIKGDMVLNLTRLMDDMLLEKKAIIDLVKFVDSLPIGSKYE